MKYIFYFIDETSELREYPDDVTAEWYAAMEGDHLDYWSTE